MDGNRQGPRATPPKVVPEPGWRPIEPPRLEGAKALFVTLDPERFGGLLERVAAGIPP